MIYGFDFSTLSIQVGEKIYIASGPRHGDWQVIEVDERKFRLRCPVSHREFEWNHFCYLVEARDDEPWPHKH
ncbi:MAG: hypothetical protein DRG58_10235 [Deltaproteobacteria bacterium]|nr:MAG: hypothetical protein DRG58_10235 [Deltaproteobacteria bacterium]